MRAVVVDSVLVDEDEAEAEGMSKEDLCGLGILTTSYWGFESFQVVFFFNFSVYQTTKTP